MITPVQIKKIHCLKNRLGWSDEQYREYLMTEGDGFAVSCKDLSEAEAERLIRQMELEAAAKGVWKQYQETGDSPDSTASPVNQGQSPKKYDDLGDRPGMASPKQLRMIEAMWRDASYIHDPSKRQVALRHIIFRITGKDDMRFLESVDARKVIEAIGHMKHKHGPVYRDRSNNF